MSNSTGNPDPTPTSVTAPPQPPSVTAPPPPTTSAPATNEPPPPSAPVVVTVVSSSQSFTTTTVITSTASPASHTPARSTSKHSSSTHSTSSAVRTSVPTSTPIAKSPGGSGGLTGTTRVVVAVVVPIIGVACIAILLLLFWKRRQQKKADEEKHRKEIEEYGYNPNQDPHVLATARGTDNEDSRYELAEGEGAGYRGWGSTNGGRRPTNMAPGVGMGQPLSPVGMAFPEGSYARPAEGPDGYVGVATSPSASTFPTGHPPSTDGNSNAPLISGRSNPPGTTTADSSVVGTIKGPSLTDDPEGVHRGVSNASSNYSAVTRSTQSDMAQPLSHHDAQYYGADTMYEDRFYYSGHSPPHAYSADNPYGSSSPPIIRDVEARRHTRIETPTNTHFPQQGNSGIAQNF